MPRGYVFLLSSALYEGNGEGGIRTLGTLLGYGALAKRCFRPLSHLTSPNGIEVAEYRERSKLVNRSPPHHAPCSTHSIVLPDDSRCRHDPHF